LTYLFLILIDIFSVLYDLRVSYLFFSHIWMKRMYMYLFLLLFPLRRISAGFIFCNISGPYYDIVLLSVLIWCFNHIVFCAIVYVIVISVVNICYNNKYDAMYSLYWLKKLYLWHWTRVYLQLVHVVTMVYLKNFSFGIE
jgi:hypothetical protein